MKKMFKHFIMTRFNTKEDDSGLLLYDKHGADEWMDSRMALFMETKKSVLRQKKREFEWIISIDKRTPERYVNEIATDPRIRIVNCNIMAALNDIEVSEPWVISTRLDCDDMLLSGSIRAIQKQFEPKLKVIDIGVLQLDFKTKSVHEERARYRGSMFISLIEPSKRMVSVYCRPHGQVARGYPLTGKFPDGFSNLIEISYVKIDKMLALMVCHNNNITNAISTKKIGELKDFYNI